MSEPTEPKLLPCPFCGGEAEIESEGLNEHRGYSIACETCNLECTSFGDSEPREIVIARWNTRANPAPVPKPLVWEDCHRSPHLRAETAFGLYEIFVRMDEIVAKCCGGQLQPCDSIEHGKQLCEQDYQRRFREMCE